MLEWDTIWSEARMAKGERSVGVSVWGGGEEEKV